MNTTNQFLKSSATALCLLGLWSCSSAPKDPQAASPAVAVSETPDYALRGRYPTQVPSWATDFETFKRTNDGKGLTYFVGESGDVNDRIAGCELAELSAKRRIAEQIAQLIMSRIGSGKSGVLSTDKDSRSSENLGTDFQDVVAGESIAFLTGVQEYGQYWEERDYSMTGGKKRVYLCQSLVTIDDAHLREAIRRTGQRVGSSLADPEAKALVDSAFKKLDDGFGKPVKSDEIDTKNEDQTADQE